MPSEGVSADPSPARTLRRRLKTRVRNDAIHFGRDPECCLFQCAASDYQFSGCTYFVSRPPISPVEAEDRAHLAYY